MTTQTCTVCNLPLNENTWEGACEGKPKPAALCIAHGTPTTGYPGRVREFAHCSVCAQRMERDWSADPQIPRSKAGKPFGRATLARARHRESFNDRLLAQLFRTVVEANEGMTVEQYYEQFPYSHFERSRESRLLPYLEAV